MLPLQRGTGAPDGRRWRSGPLVPARRAPVPDPRRLADGLPPAARHRCRGSPEDDRDTLIEPDPFEPRAAAAVAARPIGVADRPAPRRPAVPGAPPATGAGPQAQTLEPRERRAAICAPRRGESATGIVRTALCVEPRDGRLYVFLPPLRDRRGLPRADRGDRSDRGRAATCRCIIEGYPPPHDPRLKQHQGHARPRRDRGQHPSGGELGRALREHTTTLYEEARQTRLGTEKFMLDGRHTGTGGGNHVVVGGATPADSPFLRRPDLLRSLIAYWHNHPSLSLPVLRPVHRPDQPGAARRRGARRQRLRARDRASAQIDRSRRRRAAALAGRPHLPQPADRRHRQHAPRRVLHRQALLARRHDRPAGPARAARLRDAAARADEPGAAAAAAGADRAVLGRARTGGALVRWGTELHDRFMLPHFVGDDFADVIDELHERRLPVRAGVVRAALRVPLPARRRRRLPRRRARAAPGARAVARARRGARRRRHGALRRLVGRAAAGARSTASIDERHVVACNGRDVPLQPTGTRGEYVAGVRYRAWQPPNCLHPTIPVHAPLVFDLVDTWTGRSIGGCTYHVAHPGGRSYDTLPGQRLRGRRPPAGPLPRRSATRRARSSRRAEPRQPDLRSRWTCADRDDTIDGRDAPRHA